MSGTTIGTPLSEMISVLRLRSRFRMYDRDAEDEREPADPGEHDRERVGDQAALARVRGRSRCTAA